MSPTALIHLPPEIIADNCHACIDEGNGIHEATFVILSDGALGQAFCRRHARTLLRTRGEVDYIAWGQANNLRRPVAS